MNIAYVRVSTVNQNDARQFEILKKYNIEKYFEEKVSAKDTHRPQLLEMMDFVREGDTIYICDFSRIARSTKDLLEISERLQAKGVQLVSVKENIDTNTPTGKLMLTLIGAINEFERCNILEKQKEGIQIAIKEGKYKGRRAVDIPNFDKYYRKYMNREISKSKLADELNISRPTLDRLIKEYKMNVV